MRRYDEPVEVRKGVVTGAGGPVEGPEQFLWRGRLWKVRAVVGHWVETGPWWRSAAVAPVLGGETGEPGNGEPPASVHDLLAEREVWRVAAGAGRDAGLGGPGSGDGVFDLVFDWARGGWSLAACLD